MIATQRQSRKGSATVNITSDTDFVIERVFDAPAHLVYRAYTEPDLVKRWWGFESAEWVACDIDLRVDGTWRYVTRDTYEGQPIEVAFHGTYRELSAPTRIVHTEVFEGLPVPDPDAFAAVDTVDFLEADGTTTLRILVHMPSKDARDGLLASGMETGMQHSYDRMEDVLATLA
jgi:uncharacterized protein YndB with AHSA1/START domain